MILLNYGGQWLQEVWKFEFHQPVFKKVLSAGLNSLQHKRLPIFNLIFHDSNKKYLFPKDQNKAKSRNLDDSAVISSDFPGLRTFATSMTSTASTASVASMTSTASFHSCSFCLENLAKNSGSFCYKNLLFHKVKHSLKWSSGVPYCSLLKPMSKDSFQ